MTTRVNNLAPIIWQEINKAQNILLHLHPSPDGDSLGAALAMMWALEGLGKKVELIKGDSSPPAYLSQLPGFGKVSGKKYADLNIKDFDLFIILDSMDISRVTNIELIEFPTELRTIVIDHHAGNLEFGNINLVDGNYPATCQILYDLFDNWKINISQEIATCLLVGIYTDSGGFKYPPTDYLTLETAAKLAKVCKDFTRYLFELENNNEPERIKFIGLALNSIQLHFSNKVALSVVSFENLHKINIEKRHVDKSYVANSLKSVKGWEVGIAMVEVEPNVVGLSLRTRDPIKYDVAKIARATGGGDGHSVSAGAVIKLPITEAIPFLLSKIGEVYPELGEP